MRQRPTQMAAVMVSRQGRELQRYSASTGGRVVVGCVPYRVRGGDGEVEVLVICPCPAPTRPRPAHRAAPLPYPGAAPSGSHAMPLPCLGAALSGPTAAPLPFPLHGPRPAYLGVACGPQRGLWPPARS